MGPSAKGGSVCDWTNGRVQDERHVIGDCTEMNEPRFKYHYNRLNFTEPEFYRDEVKACDYVHEATQLY